MGILNNDDGKNRINWMHAEKQNIEVLQSSHRVHGSSKAAQYSYVLLCIIKMCKSASIQPYWPNQWEYVGRTVNKQLILLEVGASILWCCTWAQAKCYYQHANLLITIHHICQDLSLKQHHDGPLHIIFKVQSFLSVIYNTGLHNDMNVSNSFTSHKHIPWIQCK